MTSTVEVKSGKNHMYDYATNRDLTGDSCLSGKAKTVAAGRAAGDRLSNACRRIWIFT
jgi:hypothetical protein